MTNDVEPDALDRAYAALSNHANGCKAAMRVINTVRDRRDARGTDRECALLDVYGDEMIRVANLLGKASDSINIVERTIPK